MSTDAIINQENEKSEIEILDCNNKEKKMNIGWCMSAGIETPSNDDPNRLQRRHNSNQMHSDIFFCDSPTEDNVPTGNNVETANFTEVETDDTDQNQTQRHHFHEKTSSDIFFRDLPTEGDVSSGSASVDRDELLFASAGHDTRHADQKQGERRHFYSPSEEDYTQTESNADQDEEIRSPGTADLINFESDDDNEPDHNQTERHHFNEKTSSDIFFCHLSAEDNASSGSATVDREELLFPSAGHDTRHADQKQGERQHFHSLSEYNMQPEWSTNWDEVD